MFGAGTNMNEWEMHACLTEQNLDREHIKSNITRWENKKTDILQWRFI